ncbi:flagella synthesis protein FlgN [Serratia odorifera]|jgi:flagellar biosynthesis protein FlgN|uniref:FlgN protein n=1 Tax=Serratia odorifera DSM 4582 TaxID=667129 RepID=D4E4U6_SEROD|nr:flagellar export chaperone FlgN [Serratia odorifera]EFE95142.1 FlgN protein [Serratia odorifera DSM 4582]PNK89909.1 flagellar biosynthesis protein FlgN [Serratia odorifera]RII70507.1 flagellar biosynthesis protein FlgN [Serratia odorifera]HEJ9094165.1 flagellar export chaperone FlgN [Serratia odorifera]
MESLAQHLDTLLETLGALDSVLAEEHNLLCAGPLPGVALQRITDGKSQLLATVNYLEQQRLELERVNRLQAPYTGIATLAARWQQIQQVGQRLRDSNQHNGLLLSRHIEHNAAALTVLNKHNKTLYGPDGQSRSGSVLGRKIGV